MTTTYHLDSATGLVDLCYRGREGCEQAQRKQAHHS